MPETAAETKPFNDAAERSSTWRGWLLGFRRITSSGNFIPEIDGLRFIAVTAVVIYHIIIWDVVGVHDQTINAFHVALSRGVELFFVISGFILAVPFAAHYLNDAKPVRLKSYFLRRISRLEPPYIASLLILLALKSFSRPEDFPRIFSNFGATALYIHGFLLGSYSPVSVVAWSLEVEVQFYILMPLLALIFLIRPHWFRRALLVAVTVTLIHFQPIAHTPWFQPWSRITMPMNDRNILNYFQYFAAGILLADVWVVEWRNAPPPLRSHGIAWGDLAWVLLWPAIVWVTVVGGVLQKYTLALLIFALYLTMFRSVWPRKLMRVPVITVIGGMCYSIYLLHNAVIQTFGSQFKRFMPGNYFTSMFVALAMMIPLVLLFSGLFFKWVERPCMRRDWWPRLRENVSRKLFVEVADEPDAGAMRVVENTQKGVR